MAGSKFTGTVKPFTKGVPFRFVQTPDGDVFVHRKMLDDEYFDLLVKGATVDGLYVKDFDKKSGTFRLNVSRVFTISEPLVLTGLGYVDVVFKSGEAALVRLISGDAAGQKALLHKSTAQKAGFSLGEEMPVSVALEERADGKLAVTAMQSGEEVLAECKAAEAANKAARAAELVAQEVEGLIKNYNPKNFGFVTVLYDGKPQDCFLRRETVEACDIDAAALPIGAEVTVKLMIVPKGFEVVEIRLGVATPAAEVEVPQEPVVAEGGEKRKRKLKPKSRKPKPEAPVTSASPADSSAEGPFAGLAVLQIVGGTDHQESGGEEAA